MEPSIFDLFFGRSGFILFQNRPVDGIVEAISAQESLVALLFISVTAFRCFLYLGQFMLSLFSQGRPKAKQ